VKVKLELSSQIGVFKQILGKQSYQMNFIYHKFFCDERSRTLICCPDCMRAHMIFLFGFEVVPFFIFWTYIVAAYWNTTSWKISCISFCCHECYFIWPHNTIPAAICQFTSVWYEHDEHTFSSATSSTAATAAAKAKDDTCSATAEAIFFASFGTGVGFFWFLIFSCRLFFYDWLT